MTDVFGIEASRVKINDITGGFSIMAKKLDNLKIVMGQLIRVANTQKKFNENDRYVSLQVEDVGGDNERCLLFTEIQISDVEKVELPVISKSMKMGRIYPVKIDKQQSHLVKVKNIHGDEMIFRLSNTQLNDADSRRIRNPEDLTKKGFLVDLRD